MRCSSRSSRVLLVHGRMMTADGLKRDRRSLPACGPPPRMRTSHFGATAGVCASHALTSVPTQLQLQQGRADARDLTPAAVRGRHIAHPIGSVAGKSVVPRSHSVPDQRVFQEAPCRGTMPLAASSNLRRLAFRSLSAERQQACDGAEGTRSKCSAAGGLVLLPVRRSCCSCWWKMIAPDGAARCCFGPPRTPPRQPPAAAACSWNSRRGDGHEVRSGAAAAERCFEIRLSLLIDRSAHLLPLTLLYHSFASLGGSRSICM